MTLREVKVGRGSYLFGQRTTTIATGADALIAGVRIRTPVGMAVAIAPSSEVRACYIEPGRGSSRVLVAEGGVSYVNFGGEITVSSAPGGRTDGELVLLVAETEADAAGLPAIVAVRRRLSARSVGFGGGGNAPIDIWIDPGTAINSPQARVFIEPDATALSVALIGVWLNPTSGAVAKEITLGTTAVVANTPIVATDSPGDYPAELYIIRVTPSGQTTASFFAQLEHGA